MRIKLVYSKYTTKTKNILRSCFIMLIAIDHGNKQIKTESRIFTSGLHESDTQPPFGEDILKYKGKYYTLSEKRIPYMRDKTGDDRFYILTLFAIAFEIEDTGRYESDIIKAEACTMFQAYRL